MTLSVTMLLGLMLALTVSGKPKTYLIETVDNADILVTYVNNQRKIHVLSTVSQALAPLADCDLQPLPFDYMLIYVVVD